MTKQNSSDFYVTVTLDREAVKKYDIDKLMEILNDEIRAVLSTAKKALEKFKAKIEK